ncbi:MAG: topoisomerase DNA-binding C4 zinc finger domain-containing protein [Blautia sp.]|nr:topoisomerase DNA-binding C4 zinc finger domain-containing protein [Blautia sp.]
MLSKKTDLISRANTEMMNAIFSDVNNYRWLNSPLVFSAFERINSERKEAYQAYQKEQEQIRIRQEEVRRRQEELHRREQELRRRQLPERQKAAEEEQQDKRRLEKAQREADDRALVEAQIKIPGQRVIDSHKRRWIQCETCGKIATEGEFWTYQWNRGQCKECGSKRIPLVKEQLSQSRQVEKTLVDTNICPWCGCKLIKRNGRNGEFLGCSSYPKCRYSRSI